MLCRRRIKATCLLQPYKHRGVEVEIRLEIPYVVRKNIPRIKEMEIPKISGLTMTFAHGVVV